MDELIAKDKKSFTELNYIICNLSKELQDKIPDEIKSNIYEQMDKEYDLKIDLNKNIYEQNFLPETVALFSIIFSEYLCSEEEKKKWEEFDKTYDKIKKKDLVKFKNVDELFDKKKDLKTDNLNEQQIVVYKKSFLAKIVNKIKGFFSK